MEPNEIKPSLSRIALIGLILGIIGFLTSFLWMILLIFYPNFIDIPHFSTILSFGSIFSNPIGFIIGIIALIEIKLHPTTQFGYKQALIGMVLCLLGIILLLIIPNFFMCCTRSKVSRAKAEHQSLATALESYYTDNNVYPKPDYDEDGKPIIPHTLTTPLAYITSLFRDPFKNNGKGYYGYGGGPGVWPAGGWIVTSYGPDCVDGYYKDSIMDRTKAWSDKELGFDLISSPYTYDPTNGTTSGGDVWRRGP